MTKFFARQLDKHQESNKVYKDLMVDFIPIITDGEKYQIVQQWEVGGTYADTITLDAKKKINGTTGISGCNLTVGQFAINYKDSICPNALFVDATKFEYVNKCPWNLDYKLDITLPNGTMRTHGLEVIKYSNRQKAFHSIAIDVWVKLLRYYTKGIRLGRYFDNKLVWESCTLGVADNIK